MDSRRSEVHKTVLLDEALRPPLVPSEKNNAAPTSCRRAIREVSSRYKSGVLSTPARASTPRRCTSPSVSQTLAAAGMPPPKRAQSADRRRPSMPSSQSSRPSTPSSPSSRPSTPLSSSSRSTTPVHDTITGMHSTSRRVIGSRAPDGLWPSMRSLSSSFQSESVAAPVNKKGKVVTSSSLDQTKVQAGAVAERKRSPLRGRNSSEQSENSRPSDNLSKRAIEQHRWPATMSGKGPPSIMSRSIDLPDKVSRLVSSSISSRGVSRRRVHASDGTGKGLHQSLGEVATNLAIDGSRRGEDKIDSGSDSSSQPSERSKSVNRPSRTLSSPIPGLHCPSSPNRPFSAMSSTSRSFQSPSRSRPSTPGRSQSAATTRAGTTSPVINYIVDARKGKKSASHIENIHQLRLLYNRDLQWHFVNACADDALSFQKTSVESTLYSVWNTISKLRDSVVMKRIDVQHLKQELKLYSILKNQIAYLEQLAALERENSSSLLGATEALKASTLRLPLTSGARADSVAVKNAISSTVDIMQAMASSVSYLLSKVKDTTSLVSELSVIAAQEKVMLDECRELLATAATLQVQESSLETHLMQLREESAEM